MQQENPRSSLSLVDEKNESDFLFHQLPSSNLGLSRDELLHSSFSSEEVIERAINYLRPKLPRAAQIDKAFDLAVEAHSGKLRKVLKLPYVIHPIDAAYIVSFFTDKPDIISATLTHDVFEDSPEVNGEKIYTIDVIRKRINQQTAGYVDSVSADPSVDKEPDDIEERYWYWRNKKQKAINKVVKHSPESILIKSADVLSNIHDFRRDLMILGRGNSEKIFTPFNRSQYSILARFTHTIIDLSIAHRRDWQMGQNPLSIPLIDAQTQLIIENFDNKYEALYNDWINDLQSEKDILPPLNYGLYFRK